jgi:hypothetical protein
MFAASPRLADNDREMLRTTLLVSLFFLVGTMLAQAFTLEAHPGVWRDGSTLAVGRNFMNFWMYGRAATGDDPGRWYDLATYNEAQRAMLGADYPGQN